jgi:hypothetical protein
VQRDVEAEPVPRIQRRHGVDVAVIIVVCRRVRLEQGAATGSRRPRSVPLVIVMSPAMRGGLVAPAAAAPLASVQHSCRSSLCITSKRRAGTLDLQIADAELVRAEAAVDRRAAAAGVLDVQRLDRISVARERQRGAGVLVGRSGRHDEEAGVGDGDLRRRDAGSRVVPIALTSSVMSP